VIDGFEFGEVDYDSRQKKIMNENTKLSETGAWYFSFLCYNLFKEDHSKSIRFCIRSHRYSSLAALSGKL